jgi:hypothetical protein
MKLGGNTLHHAQHTLVGIGGKRIAPSGTARRSPYLGGALPACWVSNLTPMMGDDCA